MCVDKFFYVTSETDYLEISTKCCYITPTDKVRLKVLNRPVVNMVTANSHE